MQATVNRKQLENTLKQAIKFYPSKMGAQFLKAIWIITGQDSITLQLTDSKIEYSNTISATTEKSEEIVGVDARTLKNVISSIQDYDEVMVKTNNDNMIINNNFTLPIFDSSWYQTFTQPSKDELQAKFERGQLKQILESVIFSNEVDHLSVNDDLDHIKIENNQQIRFCVVIDYHTFSLIESNNQVLSNLLSKYGKEVDKSILVHRRHLKNLKKWLDNKTNTILTMDNERLFFLRGNEIVSLPYKTDDWLDYTLFFNCFDKDNSNTLIANRRELLNRLHILQNFITDTYKSVIWDMNTDILTLYMNNLKAQAKEVIAVNYNGELDRICFPTKHMINILKTFNTEMIKFEFTQMDGPCKIIGLEKSLLSEALEHTVITMPTIPVVESVEYE